ncbi:hypothetical protein P7K49_012074, partial [Saguinus oedipus]
RAARGKRPLKPPRTSSGGPWRAERQPQPDTRPGLRCGKQLRSRRPGSGSRTQRPLGLPRAPFGPTVSAAVGRRRRREEVPRPRLPPPPSGLPGSRRARPTEDGDVGLNGPLTLLSILTYSGHGGLIPPPFLRGLLKTDVAPPGVGDRWTDRGTDRRQAELGPSPLHLRLQAGAAATAWESGAQPQTPAAISGAKHGLCWAPAPRSSAVGGTAAAPRGSRGRHPARGGRVRVVRGRRAAGTRLKLNLRSA